MEYTIICPEETLFGISIKPQGASHRILMH